MEDIYGSIDGSILIAAISNWASGTTRLYSMQEIYGYISGSILTLTLSNWASIRYYKAL